MIEKTTAQMPQQLAAKFAWKLIVPQLVAQLRILPGYGIMQLSHSCGTIDEKVPQVVGQLPESPTSCWTFRRSSRLMQMQLSNSCGTIDEKVPQLVGQLNKSSND